MQKIYTEQSKSKVININYDTNKVKDKCIICEKSLGSSFEKREINYLTRGNFCTACAGDAQRVAYQNKLATPPIYA